jgi:hypothetical protein
MFESVQRAKLLYVVKHAMVTLICLSVLHTVTLEYRSFKPAENPFIT